MRKFLLIMFLTFTAAFTPIAARYAVQQVTPFFLAYSRFGVATLLLLIVFFIKKKNFKIDKKDWKLFLLLGALVIPINQFFFLYGIKLSSASHSGVFYACTPLFVFTTSILIKSDKFSAKKLFAISLTIIGILVIFWENIFVTGKNTSLLGDVLLFFAVYSWSLYLVFSKSMVEKYGTLKTSTMAFIIGMIMFTPIFLFDAHNASLDKVNAFGMLAFFHLSVIVAFGGYFMYTYSTKIINTSTLTTLTNTSPIITIIFSWLLLGEELSSYFIAGAVITLIGVFIAQRTTNKMEKAALIGTKPGI
ncbi:MAG: DMT family transporter [Ignavibacteriae bacterium]|nr:DMT family transporter [Ignavibacteriota bacterium]